MTENETTALATPYERWITLETAAKKLNVSKRTVERFVKAQLLATHKGKPSGARQTTRLVNPTEVMQLKHQIARGDVSIDWRSINKSGVPAKQSRRDAVTVATVHRLPAFTAVSADPWLTIEEAATYSRLPAAYLRRCILANELDARNVLNHTGMLEEKQLHPDGEPKRASWRIKRSAVDDLKPTTKEDYVGQRSERFR